MESLTKKKQFLLLQFCLLLLACTTLPEFGFSVGDIAGALFGGGGLSIPVIIARIIGIIGSGMALYWFYGNAADKLPLSFLCSAAGGIVLTLITLFPGTPDWLGYIAVAALFAALYLAKDSLDVDWKQESTQGAYLILLATLVHLYYNNIENKLTMAVAALIALFIFIKALGTFGVSMDNEGAKGVSKLKVAAWIGIVASAIMLLLGWIPLIGMAIGIIICIVNLVAFIIEFMGYGCLTRSATVGREGQTGAAKLHTSMIIGIAAAVLGIIPVVGIAGKIIAFIGFWLVLQGWTKIILGLEQDKEQLDSPQY